MNLHTILRRLIQVLTFLDAQKRRFGVTLRMTFSGCFFSEGEMLQSFRAGHAFGETPKPLRNMTRSGFSVFNTRLFVSCFCLICAFSITSCGSSGSSKSTSTITVNITPTTAVVGLGGTAQFTCLESGNANTNVTWEVDQVVGGNSTFGTISRTGLYTAPNTFSTPSTVTVSCIAQANGTSTANVPVTLSSGVTVSVSPHSANLQFGQTQQFTATVNGSSNSAVTWQAGGVSGGNSTYGTVSSAGLYTAPATATITPVAVTVTAVAQVDSSKSGNASVTIHGGIAVSLAPSSVTISTLGSQQFMATVTGTSSTGLTWEVNGVIGGSSKTGTISTTGLYSAPSSVPTTASNGKSVAATVSVTAVSQADSTAQGNVIVTIQSRNQASHGTPIPLGVSGGNVNDSGISGSSTCCAGTLGALVSRGGNQYILSASHVLDRTDAGGIGDPIIQPGLLDAACSTANTIAVANLSQFVNLENPAPAIPFVDAALARVISGQVNPLGTILELGSTSGNGQPTDAAPHAGSGVAPSIGLSVAKSGRSTGLTCSSITAINAVVNVQYQKGCGTGPSFSATFSNLVVVGDPSFSADGDSGSLLVTQSGTDPVALLVASSDSETIAAPISDVLAALADPNTSEQPRFVGTASTHPVAGCSAVPSQSALATLTGQTKMAPTAELLRTATAALDANAGMLLQNSQIRAIGVASSLDEPGKPAILLVLPTHASLAGIPTQVEGERTRILQTDDLAKQGILSPEESLALTEASNFSSRPTTLSAAEIQRARTIQSAQMAGLLKKEGIQGVAITSSADNPNEAALLVLVTRGSKHDAIPAVIDGLRTRVRESTLFRSGSRAVKSGECGVKQTIVR